MFNDEGIKEHPSLHPERGAADETRFRRSDCDDTGKGGVGGWVAKRNPACHKLRLLKAVIGAFRGREVKGEEAMSGEQATGLSVAKDHSSVSAFFVSSTLLQTTDEPFFFFKLP